MIYLVISEGIVINCVSVDSKEALSEFYPESLIIEQTGEETIGWTYDGVNFIAPTGG